VLRFALSTWKEEKRKITHETSVLAP